MAYLKIAFDHLPKTAGNSVCSFFSDAFEGARVSPHLGGFFVNHLHLFEHFDVLRGHFYGKVLHRIHPDVKFVTLLRDPIERCLSYYYYVRSYPGHHCHQNISRPYTIDEFFRHPSPEEWFMLFNNAAAHFAAAMGDARVPMKRLLSEAKNCLTKYDVVGTTEEIPLFFGDCCRTFGWPNQTSDYLENVTPQRLPAEKISPETLDIIASYNRLDLELHQFATELAASRRKGVMAFPLTAVQTEDSGEASVDADGIRVELLEANGQAGRGVNVRSGDKLSMKILLQSESISDDDVAIGFSLNGNWPAQLFQASSQAFDYRISLRPQDKKVVTLELLVPLETGSYFLELCVAHPVSSAVGKLIYFRDKRFVSLTVENPVGYQFIGVVNLCPRFGLTDLVPSTGSGVGPIRQSDQGLVRHEASAA